MTWHGFFGPRLPTGRVDDANLALRATAPSNLLVDVLPLATVVGSRHRLVCQHLAAIAAELAQHHSADTEL
jgi:hypothetical protein